MGGFAMIYFDNAATSWPKPPTMLEAMSDFVNNIGANPGRAGHRLAVESGRVVYNAREAVADLFNAPDPLRVVFGHNITESLNLCLRGMLHPGEHVITSSMEHNSVMRPLRALEKQGVELSIVECSPQGCLDPDDLKKLIRSNTKMVVLNHASNVIGTILPIKEVGKICRQHDLLLLIDTAQSAGSYPIDMQADQVDLLCFTGHKALYGPMGTGGLVVGERVDELRIEPLKRGGTGSHSEYDEQPAFLPDAFESGTLNALGLAGLEAGISWIKTIGIDVVHRHETQLVQRLIEGLKETPGVTVYGTQDATRQTATVSFNIANLASSRVGMRLDEEFGILCRVGLHCAPVAHSTIGTFPYGTVRFGLGAFNTMDEIEFAVESVHLLAKEAL
jgi:cysteine desulfurase/selenocysteine lyase